MIGSRTFLLGFALSLCCAIPLGGTGLMIAIGIDHFRIHPHVSLGGAMLAIGIRAALLAAFTRSDPAHRPFMSMVGLPFELGSLAVVFSRPTRGRRLETGGGDLGGGIDIA